MFRDQNLPQPDRMDVGAEMLEAVLAFGRYFGDMMPDDEKIEDVIAKARADYHAFVALEFLVQVSKPSPPTQLRDWEKRVYLKAE